MTTQIDKAELLRSLHVPGAPLILTNVWDAGLNLEDSDSDSSLFSIEDAASRIEAARAAGNRSGVPIVINARVDALIRGAEWPEMITRANAYLAAGADVAFVLGLNTEDTVKRALVEIDGRVSVMAGAASVPLRRLAELGVSRVSFGPGILGLALSHVRDAAETLTALRDYPPELAFPY